ncbi:MAG: hypothetical protein ACM3TR_04705 [Caulobacteraceae bacterium]
MDNLINVFSKLDTAAYSIIYAIMSIFIVSFATMLRVRGKYAALRRDLTGVGNRKDGRYKYQVLNCIIDEYRAVSTASKTGANTQAIIEKNFCTRLKGLILGERFVKNSVSLMVILGLLGTFYGLSLSVGKLVELLTVSGDTDMLASMESIIFSLISSVRGMSVAFITSLAGIACSIVITLFGIIFSIEDMRQALMIQLEEYLDNTVELEISGQRESEVSILGRTMTASLNSFSSRVEGVFRGTMTDFAEKLALASSSIETSSKCLEGTILKFNEALLSFRDNTRDFSEFNYNLRGNIERMDVSFLDLKEALAETSKLITINYKAMDEFSEAVQLVAASINESGKQA